MAGSSPAMTPGGAASVLNQKFVRLKLLELSSLRKQGPTGPPHNRLRSGSLLAQGRQQRQQPRSVELRNRDTSSIRPAHAGPATPRTASPVPLAAPPPAHIPLPFRAVLKPDRSRVSYT